MLWPNGAKIAFSLGFAREISDRIIFMDECMILENSPSEEFFNDPKTDRAKEFLEKLLRA